MVRFLIQAILRDIKLDDLEKVLKWRNQESIRNVMFNDSLISWEKHLDWYKNLQQNNRKISKIFHVNNTDYGVLNINQIDFESNKCEWGFYIGESNSPKGMGLLLGYTSLEYIFLTLGIRKLCAEVIETNKVSCNYHEKLGFKLDGILRKHIKRNNRYEDVYVYSIFDEEWKIKSLMIKNELEERFT